jgi:hypothetical protein
LIDGYGRVVEWKFAGENSKISEKILPQCYFDHNKSHTDYAEIEPETPL